MYLHLICNRNVTQGFTAEKKKNGMMIREGEKGIKKHFGNFFMILSIRSNNNKR